MDQPDADEPPADQGQMPSESEPAKADQAQPTPALEDVQPAATAPRQVVEGGQQPEAEAELFTLAFAVHQVIARCRRAADGLRESEPRAALELLGVIDDLNRAVAGLSRAPVAESNRDREKSALKLCGAMAVALAGRVPKFSRGGKPNAKEIADLVASTLSEQFPDAGTRGLGDTSVRTMISEGVQLLQR